MENIEKVLNSLSKAIESNLNDLESIKEINQKKTQAEIIKLLCDSMGVFLDTFSNIDTDMADFGDDFMDDDDDEEEPIDMKELFTIEHDFSKPKTKKKGK